MKIHTRESFDRALLEPCPGCGATHGDLQLGPKCHPRASFEAAYHEGVLTLYCAVCGEACIPVKVALAELEGDVRV